MALIDDLVAYYSLEESSGTREDAHGSNDLNSITGSPSAVSGVQGNACDFSGSSQYIARATQTWGIANAFSFLLWVSFDSFSGNPRVLTTGGGPGNRDNDVTIGCATTGQVFFNLSNAAATNFKAYTTTSAVVSTGSQFYCWLFTWDGTNWKMYQNGSEVTSITKSVDNSGTMTDTSRPLRIGAADNGLAGFNGRADEVGWWARALTSSEASELYNSGAGLSYAGLTGGGSPTFIPKVAMIG